MRRLLLALKPLLATVMAGLLLFSHSGLAALSFSEFEPGDRPAEYALSGDISLDFSEVKIAELKGEGWLQGQHGPLPPIVFSVVSDDRYVVPIQRSVQTTDNLYWDYIVGAGQSWQEGSKSVASLPFTLIFRWVNCSHNGAIKLTYDDKRITRAELLVGQETCHFKRVNIAGRGKADYRPGVHTSSDEVLVQFREERARRWPVYTLEDFERDHQAVDLRLFRTGLPDDDDLSTLGFYYQGKHYNGGCNTRFGPYPYCDDMVMTSFSTAKSAFAGLALLSLAEEFGPDVMKTRIVDLLPEAKDAKGDWRGVTLDHVADMTTGNFAIRSPMADADPGGFYTDGDRAQKLLAAFNSPYAEPPGEVFIYQTADTFIQIAAMDAYLQQHSKAHTDAFDYVVDRIYKPLHVSPDVLFTRRTRDDGLFNSGTAFGGMGMFWTTDAVVKVADFLQTGGKIDGRQLLHAELLEATLQRDPDDRGMETDFFNFLYNNNLWAVALKPFGPEYGCNPHVTWMSGLSGVRVYLMPNDLVVYYFNDAQAFPLPGQIAAANKIKRFCPPAS
ncbi:MAG: hypothetical protein AAF525_05110 [Pseudomonadota bacterium]